jgi:hypothetical protein
MTHIDYIWYISKSFCSPRQETLCDNQPLVLQQISRTVVIIPVLILDINVSEIADGMD